MEDFPQEEDIGAPVEDLAGDTGLPAGTGEGDRLSWGEQTILAVQQFSMILGVILLVGSCFLLMIGTEIFLGWLEDQCSRLMGREKEEETDDPAALVGSFKRYK